MRHILLRERHAYLSTTAERELNQLIASSQDLFEPVLQGMLENTGHLFRLEIGIAVCKEFLHECFARFGSQLARMVATQLSSDDLFQSADVGAAFEAAAANHDLSDEAKQSLEVRCMRFLKSSDPADVKLKFHLTQGFYLAQLLGYQEEGFNPLAEEAFWGLVFYLDTNILLIGLLRPESDGDLFSEMVRVANKLGIALRVTRATINETRRVAADRATQIERTLEKLPDEIVRKSQDAFATAFFDERGQP